MTFNISKFDQSSVIKYRVKKLSESSSSIVFFVYNVSSWNRLDLLTEFLINY